jgi:hypothetical protein
VKIEKRRRAAKAVNKPFDRISAKERSSARRANRTESPAKTGMSNSTGKRRGRPRHIPASTVAGRAENYRRMFVGLWPRLGGPLLAAQNEEQVIAAFENHGQPYAGQFMPWAPPGVLAVIRDPKFPKTAKAQPGFLADSLAGWPNVTPRTSRDICERERARERQKTLHHIIRKEYYIECSCGYKGPALDNACRHCGAEVVFSFEELTGPRLF